MEKIKICNKCKYEKQHFEFSKNKSTKDGLFATCKVCKAEIDKIRYINEKDQILSKKRIYIEKIKNSFPIIISEYKICTICKLSKKQNEFGYSKSSLDKLNYNCLICMRLNTNSPKEKLKRKNRPSLKESRKRSNHKRRAIKMNIYAEHITKEQWFGKLEEFEYCCAYCLLPENIVGKLTMDHFIALANNGTHTIDNLVPACRSCNCSKGKREILDFVFKWRNNHPNTRA